MEERASRSLVSAARSASPGPAAAAWSETMFAMDCRTAGLAGCPLALVRPPPLLCAVLCSYTAAETFRWNLQPWDRWPWPQRSRRPRNGARGERSTTVYPPTARFRFRCETPGVCLMSGSRKQSGNVGGMDGRQPFRGNTSSHARPVRGNSGAVAAPRWLFWLSYPPFGSIWTNMDKPFVLGAARIM
jgi:hypothetical protein